MESNEIKHSVICINHRVASKAKWAQRVGRDSYQS